MTPIESALEFLRCARANLDDAATELSLTDRHDRDLLAETIDRIERDVRAVETAIEHPLATAARSPGSARSSAEPARPHPRGGGTSRTYGVRNG